MKKFKLITILIMLFGLTGCFRNDSMDNISIVTSTYPIEYVVNYLYGKHSTINSIYPLDSEINDFKVTKVLLNQYSDNDLFIFNGLSNEKDYVKTMLKNNNDLKIIDVTSNMNIDYKMEEIWLDPNNLLTIANNIKKGFNEYLTSRVLMKEINDNYENLKIELTNLDGRFYSLAKNATNKTIIVSNNAFKYLEKYGIEVISLDEETVTSKDIATAKELLKNNDCLYVYTKYEEELSDTVNSVMEGTSANVIELYTMTNLHDIVIDKTDYITLMNQNLENIKLELYK